MQTLFVPAVAAVEFVVVVVVASVLCDGIHAFLHRISHVRLGPLRAISRLHQAHHDFYDRQLQFHGELLVRSLLLHQLPELFVRCGMIAAVDHALFGGSNVVGFAIAVCVVEFIAVVVRRGHDVWHSAPRPLRAPRSRFFVDDAFHALHHAFPDHFIAGHVPVIDWVFGTLLPLRDRVVVVVGSSQFCSDLCDALYKEGAVVHRLSDEAAGDAALAAADVVVFGHDDAASAHAALLVRLQRLHAASTLPLEVWSVAPSQAFAAVWPLLQNPRTVVRTLNPRWGARFNLWSMQRSLR